jgi:2-polyprenyl-3-methyl-5-hydroxy-6-metoxy-1,4-benzoquinol methylase
MAARTSRLKIDQLRGELPRRKWIRTANAIDYFESTASAYDRQARERKEFDERFALFARLANHNVPEGGRALDFGCGNGILSQALSAAGFAVTGTDGSESMIAMARNAAPAAEFIVSPIPLPPATLAGFRGAFDIVVASSVIEYIQDDFCTMQQMHEALRPGGVALVSFPNLHSRYRQLETVALRTPLVARQSYLRFQKHRYDEGSARSLARRAGFDDTSVNYFGLPFQRYLPRIDARPAWLATMFVLTIRRREDPGQAAAS